MWICKTKFLLSFYVVFLTFARVKGYMSKCGGALYLRNADSFSRSYTPYNYYPPSDWCRWKITAPLFKVVKLTFTSFNLESSSYCNNDYLSVYDGSSDTSSIIGKFCGTRKPPVIISKGRYLYLKFKSNSYSNYRGFTITYSAQSPATSYTKCTLKNSFANNNNIVLTSSSGYIYSPEYPSYYPSSMQCTWKIKVQSGKKIKLYFEYMNVWSSIFCTNDYLRIRDGYYSTSTKKGDYCGTTRRTIYSSGRYLWLRFVSDSSFNSKGFKLRYTTESEGSGSVGVIIGIIIGIAVIVAVIVIIVYCTKKNRRGVVTRGTPSTITTTTVTTAPQPQGVALQPVGQAPPPYQNPYPQKAGHPPHGYAGPPPQGYAGPPPQGYAGPPPQGYAGPPPQGYAGPAPQGYAGPPPQGYAGPPPQDYAVPPPQGYPGPPPQGYSGPSPQGFQLGPPPMGPPAQTSGPTNVSI